MDNNADDLALVEKTIETIKDIATSITANSAIGPKPDPEQVAGTTNEQILLGDAAIAPEAAPALIAPKKPKKRRAAPKKSAKQVAQPAAKTPKKAAKKAAKKSSKKSAKKTKSSAKAVGKSKTAKKVAKKKKAKKSKRS
jgi:hypothetical protein